MLVEMNSLHQINKSLAETVDMFRNEEFNSVEDTGALMAEISGLKENVRSLQVRINRSNGENLELRTTNDRLSQKRFWPNTITTCNFSFDFLALRHSITFFHHFSIRRFKYSDTLPLNLYNESIAIIENIFITGVSIATHFKLHYEKTERISTAFHIKSVLI